MAGDRALRRHMNATFSISGYRERYLHPLFWAPAVRGTRCSGHPLFWALALLAAGAAAYHLLGIEARGSSAGSTHGPGARWRRPRRPDGPEPARAPPTGRFALALRQRLRR